MKAYEAQIWDEMKKEWLLPIEKVVLYSEVTEEIEKRDQEIAKLEAEAALWEKSSNIEWAHLECLIAALKDDERAEKVAVNCRDQYHDNRWCPTCENRKDGIDEYRAEILKEVEG